MIICLAGCLSCSNSGKTTVDQKTIDEVTALLTQYTNNWAEAIKNKDASKITDYFAPDLVFQEATGLRVTKEELIKEINESPNTIKSFVVKDLQVKLFGPDLANVTGGGSNVVLDSNGKEQIFEARYTNVWKKNSGKWQVIIGHGNPLQTGSVKPDAEVAAELEQVWRDYIEVTNSDDIEKLMTFFTDDYVNMPSYNSTQNGKEETREFMKAFLENSKPKINWYRQSEAFVHGDMAYTFGTFEMVSNPGGVAGKPVLQRCITVYKKDGESKWKLYRWMGQD